MEQQPENKILLGTSLVALSVFLIAAMAAIAKTLSADMHPIELAFYRNLMVFLGMFTFLTITNKWNRLKTKRYKAHVSRALIGTFGLIAGLWSVSLLPLATSLTLYYTAPLFIVLLSWPMLREPVGWRRYIAVIIGFVGVVLVVQPSGQEIIILGLIFAFFDSFCSALTQIFLRDLGKTENSFVTVFYYMGIGTITTLILMPFVWTGIPLQENFILLIGLGLTGWLQQITKTKGFSVAPAAVTAPINYIGIIWAALFGWIFWDTLPTIYLVIGATIIVGSNLYILYRERRKSIK